jgi:hypothetical protein
MRTKLVIFGNTAFAEIADEYFTHDSPYEVVAFTAHRKFVHEPVLRGRPVIPTRTYRRANTRSTRRSRTSSSTACARASPPTRSRAGSSSPRTSARGRSSGAT